MWTSASSCRVHSSAELLARAISVHGWTNRRRSTACWTCVPVAAASPSSPRMLSPMPKSMRWIFPPMRLAVAQRNVSDYKLQDRVHLIESDLFANLQRQTIRHHHQQPALRGCRIGRNACRRNTGTNRNWRWAAAKTDWMPRAKFSKTPRQYLNRERRAGSGNRPQPRSTGSRLPGSALHLA